MYLTRVVLNLQDWSARADLADPYQLHSTLARLMSPDDATSPGPYLWRSERAGKEHWTVLLQSRDEPRWGRLDERQGGWAGEHATRAFDPARLARSSEVLRFRLRANPTVCRNGKRHGLFREDEQLAWLARKGAASGFEVVTVQVSEPSRLVGSSRKTGDARIVAFSVLYDGILRVRDAAALEQAVISGLGRCKHMGLGLLSLARVAA